MISSYEYQSKVPWSFWHLLAILFDLHEFRQRAYQGKFRNLNSVIQRKKKKSRWKSITTSPRPPHHQLFSDAGPKRTGLCMWQWRKFLPENGFIRRHSDVDDRWERPAVSIVIFLLPKDAGKVDVQSILSCQNGGAYGPKSIKSKDLK